MSENYTVYMHRFPNGKVYIGMTSKNQKTDGKEDLDIEHKTYLRQFSNTGGTI